MMTCNTCGSRLRAVVLASDDEGPQEVESACAIHGVQWRYQSHRIERVKQPSPTEIK
jgi:hypothetical protein